MFMKCSKCMKAATSFYIKYPDTLNERLHGRCENHAYENHPQLKVIMLDGNLHRDIIMNEQEAREWELLHKVHGS